MKFRLIRRLVALVCLSAACSPAPAEPALKRKAPAPDVNTASFQTDGIAFVAPLPSGYCLPTGRKLETANVMASGDPTRTTLLTIFPCGETEASNGDYIIVKTPVSNARSEFDRGETLDELEAKYSKLQSVQSSENERTQAEALTSKMNGGKTSVQGDIRWAGRDEVCNYLAGSITYRIGNREGPVAAAVCMTVVRRKALILYTYGDNTNAGSIARLLPRLRGFAEGLIAANE
jgi:hypothetical protein